MSLIWANFPSLSKTLLPFTSSILIAHQDAQCSCLVQSRIINLCDAKIVSSALYNLNFMWSELWDNCFLEEELLRIAFFNFQSFTFFLCIVIPLNFCSSFLCTILSFLVHTYACLIHLKFNFYAESKEKNLKSNCIKSNTYIKILYGRILGILT